jgi:hypothetical protein
MAKPPTPSASTEGQNARRRCAAAVAATDGEEVSGGAELMGNQALQGIKKQERPPAVTAAGVRKIVLRCNKVC